jgi:hypothetical protein
MTGKGLQIMIKAFHILLGELFSWLQNRRRNKPKKE